MESSYQMLAVTEFYVWVCSNMMESEMTDVRRKRCEDRIRKRRTRAHIASATWSWERMQRPKKSSWLWR